MSRLIARLEKVLTVAALLLLPTTALAQGAPDFSGRWTAVPEPPQPPGVRAGSGAAPVPSTMGSGWGPSLTIEHKDSALVVDRAQFVQYDMQPPMRFRYALDGSESRNTINIGRGPQELVSKAAWEGTALAITTSFRFTNPRTGAAETSELKQVLSLDPAGALVITTTVGEAVGGPASTMSTTYKKAS